MLLYLFILSYYFSWEGQRGRSYYRLLSDANMPPYGECDRPLMFLRDFYSADPLFVVGWLLSALLMVAVNDLPGKLW